MLCRTFAYDNVNPLQHVYLVSNSVSLQNRQYSVVPSSLVSDDMVNQELSPEIAILRGCPI